MAEASGAMATPKPTATGVPAGVAKPATTNPQPTPSGTVGAVDPSKSAGSVPAHNAPFEIRPIRKDDHWAKLLFYATHGVGKTELATSAVDVEEMRDVLMINADMGTKTTATSPRIKNADLIDTIEVNQFYTVARIQEFLTAHCYHRDRGDDTKLRSLQDRVLFRDPTRLRKYKTLIIDTVTEVEVFSTYKILGIDLNSERPVDEDIDTAGWPEFRKNFEMVKLLVRAIRNLPMHVIMLCQRQYRQDERKLFHYSPKMTGQLSTDIQGFVDMVGYLITGDPTEKDLAPRRLYVQPITGPGIPKFDAKNRFADISNPYFDNPTMTDLARLLKITKS